MSDEPRFCRETQAQLPFLVSGELTGWGARVVRAHLKRCEDCRAELARQEQLTSHSHPYASHRRRRPRACSTTCSPALMAGRSARRPRCRRGEPSSGARPAMSVAFLTVGAAASTGVGYALYKGARWALVARRH